jgi:serine/threonine protein kinase
MFAAVNELHKLGYIHRDLKPEVNKVNIINTQPESNIFSQNFLIDGTGHVKLTDFGLATGALTPRRIESLKAKVGDELNPHHSVLESCHCLSARQGQG